jgi:single-stranded DNA-binding protein
MTMAHATVAGTIEGSPEKRFTSQNNVPVTVFTLSVPQNSRNSLQTGQQDFFQMKVTCWRKMADLAGQLSAGNAVAIDGKLMFNTLTTPEGMTKKQFELEANNISLLPGLPEPLTQVASSTYAPGSASNSNVPQPSQSTAPSPPAHQTVPAQDLSDLTSEDFLTEDDIPF